MSTEAEANLTDLRAPLSHEQCIELADLIASLRAEAAHRKEEHERVCALVARMHAAAVGEMRGPIRGVVEDVADLRAELDTSRLEAMALRAQVEAAVSLVAEQLDLLKEMEAQRDAARARIAELEDDFRRSVELLEGEREAVRDRVVELESALTEERNAHQATAKERDEACDLVAQFEAGLSRGAALPAAVLIDRARKLLASLPAGPREDR